MHGQHSEERQQQRRPVEDSASVNGLSKECQEEVEQLLDKTKHEMQAAVESGVPSQRALSGPTPSQQEKVDSVTNAAFPGQGKGKKRQRTEQSLEGCKQERSMKVDGCDLGQLKQECNVKFEDITNIAGKHGGLTNISGVDQLILVMHQAQNDDVRKSGDLASRRMLLANIVAETEREDCLTRFVQLGGLPVLDYWLQEAHKGMIGDDTSPKEGDEGLDDILLSLLRALDKLPVDLDALKTCKVGKSVNNLRSHRNLEIQKRARKLVDRWKKRVKVEMKSSGESNPGSNTASSFLSKQPSTDAHGTKGGSATEGGSIKSTAGVKPVMNGSCPGYTKCSSMGCGKDHPLLPSTASLKGNPVNSHASVTSDTLVAGLIKEEKSSSSSQSQNNSLSWCSGLLKGAGSSKEEVKTSSAISTGTKTTTTLCSRTHSWKAHHTASLSGTPKESQKHSGWDKQPGSDKALSPSLLEKGTVESLCAESTNNQRLIVRIPNPGRSPARSFTGCSLADGGTSASRDSSPGSSERHDSVDGNGKARSAPALHSVGASGDTRVGNGNSSGGKAGVDCIEDKVRSSATADDTGYKLLDAEQEPGSCWNHSNDCTGRDLADSVQLGTVKRSMGASVASVGYSDISVEVCVLGNKVGIDLLANIAACEGSETELEGQSSGKDAVKEPVKQTESTNDGEEFLVSSHKDDEKWKDGLTRPSMKGLLEPGSIGERVEPQSLPAEEVREPADASKDQHSVLTSEGSPRENVRDDAPLVSPDSSAATGRQTETFVDNRDESGANVVGENTNDDKGSVSRLSGDMCNGSSLTAACQTGLASGQDNIGLMEKDSSSLSSLVKIPSVEYATKTMVLVSGDYEEDALVVAQQVAREIKQEVERYGKPKLQDVNAASLCKTECSHEIIVPENVKNCWIPQGEATDASVKDPDHDADDSQETVRERREEMEVHRVPSGGEGEDANLIPCALCNPHELRQTPDVVSGSIVDDINTKEMKEVGTLDASAPAVREEFVDNVVCIIHAAEAAVPDESAALNFESTDSKYGSSDVSERPIFDLNEGFVAEEAPNDNATSPTVASCNPTVLFRDSSSGPPAMLISLAAPIAVVAASKGAFIPPSNPLRSKAELGWKGSAATSAFRPAEPRRTVETLQSPSDTAAAGAAANCTRKSEKRARFLEIDLNVADERAMEDVCMASQNPVSGIHPTSLGSGFQVPVVFSKDSSSSGLLWNSVPKVSRPVLDLNRVNETDESMAVVMSNSMVAEISVGNNKLSFSATHVTRNFDLNDGPGLEEPVGEGASVQQSNVKLFDNPALPVLSGMRPSSDFSNVAAWYPATNPVNSVVMPAVSVSRAESCYQVVAAPAAKNAITVGHSLSPFNGDIYRAGGVISSPVSYSTTMPAVFPYTRLQFGSGLPFSSASFNMSSTNFSASTNSAPFPTTPLQLVSAGAVVSPYGRPYLTRITEVPESETGVWSRRNLDLNAGPDAVDIDAKEEGFVARQMPAVGQLSFQQVGSSGVTLKRKEPESSFDPFRSGFKQMTWR